MSSIIRDEAFLENQLQIAGSNQSRILENLARNKNSTKNQALVVKVVYAILIGILPLMPLFMYFQIRDLLLMGPITADTIIFASAVLLSIYFGMNFMYMFILGVISLSGFMSGEVFNWLEILPIPRHDLQKIGFIVLWRFFDIPLVVSGAVFPVLMTWATGNFLVCIICVMAAVLNTLFIFFILIIVTEKYSRTFKGSKTNTTKANIIRVITMLGYIIPAVLTGQLFSWALESIGPLIANFVAGESPMIMNFILSLVPFPFAPCFLLGLTLLPQGMLPIPLLVTTLIGVSFLVIIIWRLYKVVLGNLQNLTSHQIRVTSASTTPLAPAREGRPILPVTAVKAFLRKDVASLSRDFQGMLYLLMPFVYPFIMFLPTINQAGNRSLTTIEFFGFLFMFLIMITVMNAGMLVAGLLSLEDSGASIIAALPIVPRDQAKAKLIILCTIQAISSLIPIFLVWNLPNAFELILLLQSFCLIGLTIAIFTFILKIRLFGKMRYKFVVEEVMISHKVAKWFAIITIDVVILLGLWFFLFFLADILTTVVLYVTFTIMGGGGILAMMWTFNRMFPKVIPARAKEIPPK